MVSVKGSPMPLWSIAPFSAGSRHFRFATEQTFSTAPAKSSV
jgi:hypothetical protein